MAIPSIAVTRLLDMARFGICVLIALSGWFPVSDLIAAEVSVTTADGGTASGTLLEITESGIRLGGPKENAIVALEDLSQLATGNKPRQPLPMRAALVGGSELCVTGLTWTGDAVEFAVAGQSPLSVPARQLRWVRFRAGSAATDPVWLGWLEEIRRADRLVVRRSEKALDSIDGTVLGIGRDTVKFEMRDNPIDAPLAKLEGILFSSPADEPAPSGITVLDIAGSQWAANSLQMPAGGSAVRVELAGGIEHEIPLDQVLKITFAGGILALSDLEVAAAEFGEETPAAGGATKSAALNEWFGPQSKDGMIRIDAPGAITLRIPDGYQKLIVASRRSRDVSQFTALQLEVLVDGEVRWTGTLQDRESLGLELPISGARQLTLRASRMSPTNESSPPHGAALGGSIEWFSGRLLK